MTFALVDEQLEATLLDPQARTRWLILDRHPDFPGHWIVDGFTNEFMYDFGEIIGSYRALAPSGLEAFMEVARECEYEVAFFEDPASLLDDYRDLDIAPEITINSSFENTINGMLAFQVQGYNVFKDLDWGVARWDTGTGKTVLGAALIKHHRLLSHFDLCFFVVKKNNKVNTVRKLKTLVDIDASYIRGPKAQRDRAYQEIAIQIAAGDRPIVILNYEQFKTDFVYRDEKGKLKLTDWGEEFFPKRNLMFVWDEMPVKLKTRTTELYKAICKCLYRTDPPQVSQERLRPNHAIHFMLSATPIENSPEDWFDCIRLMDGGRTYGTVSDFHNMYVKSWNFYDPSKPYEFHNFERMRLKAAHFVHQVDKTDPKIAAVFPKVIEEVMYIDWDEGNRKLYDRIAGHARGIAECVRGVPILAMIGTLQMMCDAPEMIKDSAARREVWEDAVDTWELSRVGQPPTEDGSEFALTIAEKLSDRLTNKGHPKLEALHEILSERHPEAQVAIYTKWNATQIPYLIAALDDWGISYVHYSGSENQLQSAQDAFQRGEARVFLSSDSGSDSIDLDAGNVVIDYNLPWKWTTVTQRHNRVHRATSAHETVYYYSLIMAGSVEERVLRIIERKRGFHNELFDPAAGDLSASMRMTREELMWILTGSDNV